MRWSEALVSFLAVVLAGGLAVQPSPALGADDTIPIGKTFRVSPKAADSRCIGNPKTPLCAIDTFFACLARLDHALCERVGVKDWEYPIGQGPEGEPEVDWIETTRLYTIKSQDVVTQHWIEEEILPPDRREYLKPGDLRIDVEEIDCLDPGLEKECSKERPSNLVLRKSSGKWRMIAYIVRSDRTWMTLIFY